MYRTLTLIFLLFSSVCFADEYYIGQYVWNNDANDPHWEAPDLPTITGTIDLRNITQQSQVGGAPQGYGIFSYSSPVSDSNLFDIGNDVNVNLSTAKKNALLSRLGLGSFVNSTFKEILWEILTSDADVTGLSKWRPIMPDNNGKIKLLLGSLTPIKQTTLIPFKSKEWDIVLKNIQQDYREYLKTESYETVSKILDGWEQQYKVPYDYFIPDDAVKLASLPHGTSYSENWNCADSSSITCQLTWTAVLGAISISGNLVTHTGVNSRGTYRAEHDVSSANHAAQIDVVFLRQSANVYLAEPTARFSPSAQTYYSVTRFRNSDNTNNYRITKKIAGTETVLVGPNTLAFSFPETWKIETNGSTISSYFNGAIEHVVTDTSITTGTRGGISLYSNDGFHVDADNFSISDILGNDVYDGGVSDGSIFK